MFIDDAKLVAFVPSTDLARARAFYSEVLDLELISEDPFGLIYEGGGTRMRVATVPAFTPIPGTALGWRVEDVEAAVDALVERGVSFERFEHFRQDARGIWTTPDGAGIAWFLDPDGNWLSLTGLPPRGGRS